MAIISTANLEAIADSIAKQISDFRTNYITNAAANAPTSPTILTGVTALAVSTTSTTPITAPGFVTVTPGSLADIYPGTQLTTSGGTTLSGGAITAIVETVPVIATNPAVGTFTALFNYTHYGTTTYTQSAANSLTKRIAGLTDFAQQVALETAAVKSVGNVAMYITALQQMNNMYANYFNICDALDNHVGGLNAFLTTNVIGVNEWFASAFNYYAANATGAGLRGPATAPTAIAAANVFADAAYLLGTIAVSGASAGTYTQGVQLPSVLGSPALYIWKTDAGSASADTVFNVSYINASGSVASQAVTLTGSFATGITNAIAVGSITGSMVTNITVTSSGTSSEHYAVGVAAGARAAAY